MTIFDRQTDRQTGRVEYLDAAKGIGIILVVLGHLITLSSYPDRFIYSFHMPFFFLVSGVFASVEKYSFREYFVKNVKRLLIPYFVFFVIGLVISLCVPMWRDFSIKELAVAFITTPRLVNMNPIWFLTCLFVVAILFFPFYKVVLLKSNWIIAAILLLSCVIIAPEITHLSSRFDLFIPLKIDVAFAAFPFYTLGFLFKEKILHFEKLRYKIGTLIICLFITAMLSYRNGLVAMVNNSYGKDLLWYLICALSGSALVIILGFYLRRIALLRYIGRNSLVVFSIHLLLIKVYVIVLSKVTGESKAAQNNLDYLQITIGFIIVIFISLFIAWSYNRIKSFILSKVSKRG